MPILIIILCALGGFSLATFIHYKKKKQKPIICPIGHSCDPVVRSRYSHIMGVPVEVLGALYYLITFLSYATFLMYPGFEGAWIQAALFAASGLAFVFSLYLTAIQAFVLKEWCT